MEEVRSGYWKNGRAEREYIRANQAESRLRLMEEALRFYADPTNYLPVGGSVLRQIDGVKGGLSKEEKHGKQRRAWIATMRWWIRKGYVVAAK